MDTISLSLTGALDRATPLARSSPCPPLSRRSPPSHSSSARTETCGKAGKVSAVFSCPASEALWGSRLLQTTPAVPHTHSASLCLAGALTRKHCSRKSRRSQVQPLASLCDPDKLLDLEPQLPNLCDGKSNTRCGREKRCSLVGAGQGCLLDVGFLFSIHTGAHLNPAFSLTMCLLGRFPWVKLPIYALVQTFAAFCAAAATYVLYYGKSE